MVIPNLKEKEGDSYMEIEYADILDGYRLHIKGAEFPLKGKPASPEVLASIALLKRIVIEGLKILFALPLLVFAPSKFLSKVITSFTLIAKRLVKFHLLETALLSPFSREFELFLCIFLLELDIKDKDSDMISIGKSLPVLFAHYVANLIEYDSAYRWRLQDLFSESSAATLFTWKELKRLEQIALKRNDARVGKQSAQVLRIIRYSLIIPSVRKALRKTIGMVNYERLCFDEGDRYWASFKLDYDFFGQTAEERMKALQNKGYKIPFTQKA